MERLVDYLLTPSGMEVTRAIAILISGVGAWFAWRAHGNTEAIKKNGKDKHEE